MNEGRFTGKADIYRKFRSSYPKELIDYLYVQVGFKESSVIADIGSGTGIFSRLLLERGSRVYCVEPNEDMRRAAEQDLGGADGFEGFVSINASADDIELGEESVDFVTAAQAFHWFDRASFQKECRRILKNGGKVVLVWNVRDFEHEIVKRDYVIREKYCVDRKGFGEAGGPPKDCTSFFADAKCEVKKFRNDLVLDREGYIGMNLSRSYAPKEDAHPEQYRGLVRELGVLFDEYGEDGIMRFPQFTQSFAGYI